MKRVGFSGLIKIEFPGRTLRLSDGSFIDWGGERYTSKDSTFGIIGGLLQLAIRLATWRVRRQTVLKLATLDAAERRIMETRAQGIEILEQIAARIGSEPTRISIPQWHLGDLTFIGIPGELFASLGELCTQGDDRRVILGYTNGYLGYFANRAAYDDGLYEALASPFAPGASEAMVARLLGDQ